MSRILDASLRLCLAQGSADAELVAEAISLPAQTVRDGLAELARRGEMIARLGGVYARPLARQVRLPGQSYVSDIPRLSLALMMGARA